MHVLIIVSDAQRSMFISPRGKRRLQAMINLAQGKGWVWRYHNGSGWADGSDESWKVIQSITEPCMARIVY